MATKEAEVSEFDPDNFMQSAAVESQLDTSIPPIPAGDYQAQIEDKGGVKLNVSQFAGTQDPSKTFTVLEIPFVIVGTGDDTIDGRAAKYKVFLDIDGSGGLDVSKGQNIGLGRLRDAVSQNTGDAWTIPMLMGASCMVKIGHTPDKNDPEIVYHQVDKVTRIV